MTSFPVTTRAMEENESLTDPYFDTARCVRRLLAQYRKHPRLIVGADWDETLHDFYQRGDTYPAVTQLLLDCQTLGFSLIILTSSPKSRHPEIHEGLAKLGLRADAINESPVVVWGAREGKPYYNHFLDDKGGLFQAYVILQRAVTLIKGSLALRAAGDEVGAEAVLTRGSV